MARKGPISPVIEPKEFRSAEEISRAISKLKRRIDELEKLDVAKAVLEKTGEDAALMSNIQATIREIFGLNAPEYHEHKDMHLWTFAELYMGISDHELAATYKNARRKIVGILNGLVSRLQEKLEDFGAVGDQPRPSSYFDKLNLHPRIAAVARDLFQDGHYMDAVFNASKALINYVKERSGRFDIDGTPLVRQVFSKNNPILAFNDLATPMDLDQQEGIMHLFEGAVLGIRNPGGHSFPEGTEQRAIEYISLLSLLAYLVDESKKRIPK